MEEDSPGEVPIATAATPVIAAAKAANKNIFFIQDIGLMNNRLLITKGIAPKGMHNSKKMQTAGIFSDGFTLIF